MQNKLILPSMPFAFFLISLLFGPASSAQEELTIIQHAKITLVRNTEVASKDPGIVRKVLIKTGVDVQEQETLIELDSKSFRVESEMAHLDLQIAEREKANRTHLEYALKTKQVAEKVVQRLRDATTKMEDVVSKTELEQRQLELEQAIASVKQAEHDIVISNLNASLKQKQSILADLRLANRNVLSPLKGRVAEVFVEQGEYVAAGQSVARIINLEKLRVQASVPAELYGELKIGQRIRFSTRLGTKQIQTETTISYISAEIDVANQDALIWAEFENTDLTLVPGIAGTLTIFKNKD